MFMHYNAQRKLLPASSEGQPAQPIHRAGDAGLHRQVQVLPVVREHARLQGLHHREAVQERVHGRGGADRVRRDQGAFQVQTHNSFSFQNW